MTRFTLSGPARAAIRNMILGLIGLALFVLISDAVINTGLVLDLDAEIAGRVHDAGTTPVTEFFNALTVLGSQVLWLVGFGVGLPLLVRRQWAYFIPWILASVIGPLLNALLKLWFERPRPAFEGWPNPLTTYGYPSGHAMQSLIMYGLMTAFMLAIARDWRARLLIVKLAATLIVLIAISRIAINAHFFSDVIGGLVAGAIWLATCVGVWRALRGDG